MAMSATPYVVQNGSHSGALFRQATSAPFTSGGVLASTEMLVTAQSTPNMSVSLGAGRVIVPGTSVSPPVGQSFTTQASYFALNDAPLTLTVAASNPTNARIDAQYAQIQDSFYSGSTNTSVAGIVTGTPAPSPAPPAIPTNSLLVAYIAVGANVTSIVSANITQQVGIAGLLGAYRQFPTLALLQLVTTAPPLSHATVYADPTAANNGDYVWSGTAWVRPIADSLAQVLTLSNSWVAYGSGFATPSYRNVGGHLELFGMMKLGSTLTTVATLPGGSKPLATRQFLTASNTGAAVLNILSTGVIQVAAYTTGGGNGNVSLDGISFTGEQ
jgi:hypothetical protein